ncbi:uncharacterized protein [Nerophis lumbriciformis]|uniref:uncharacterized protein isoform X2 n=1 Tax=Nerophis lumbriciformis TaxID=546530 RepID=UPI002AE04B93|nr:uncharacterized protein LOC133570911 isoform X2 [Nerophis lumbriciformis]
MQAFLLLGCVVFATSEYIFGSAHMLTDDRLSTNKNWQNQEGGREQRGSKRTRSAIRGAPHPLRTVFPCGGAVNLRGTFAATCAPSATVASSEPSVTAGWATLAAEHTRSPRGRGGDADGFLAQELA